MSASIRDRTAAPPARGAAWTYDAFISYAWADDQGLARQLQRDLQRLGKPIFSRRARSVFLDTSELGADPSLWSKLRSTLDGSEWLVFLASPAAADPNAYVAQEVEHWLATREASHVLVALVGGRITWDRDAGRFDRSNTDALPEPLLNAMDGPLWVDLTEFRDRSDLSLDLPAWREKVAELAAPLAGSGVTKSDLIDEDLAIQHKRKRLRNAAITGLIALTIAASVAGIVAVNNAQEAEARRRDAVARQLSAQSLSALGSELDLSLLLAAEAEAVAPITAARDATLRAAHGRPELVAYLRGQRTTVLGASFDPSGESVVTTGVDGRVYSWELASGERAAVGRLTPTTLVAFSEDGGMAATEVDDVAVAIWDAGSWEAVGPLLLGPTGDVTALALDASRGIVAIGGSAGEAVVYSLPTSDSPALKVDLHAGAIHGLALSPTEPVMATAGADGTVVLSDIDTGTVRHTLVPGSFKLQAGSALFAVAFSPDGTQVAAGGFDEIVTIWDVATGEEDGPPRIGHDNTIRAIAYNPTGTALATAGHDEKVIVWDLVAGTSQTLFGHDDSIHALAFSGDGSMLVSGGSDHLGILWQVSGSRVGAVRLATATGPATWLDDVTLLSVDESAPTLFDTESGVSTRIGARREAAIRALDIHQGRQIVVTADLAGVVAAADTTSGRALQERRLHDQAWDVTISPDGSSVASVGSDGGVVMSTLPELETMWQVDERRGVTGVVFDSAGRRLATLGDGGARVYVAGSGEEITRIPIAVSAYSAVFADRGRRLVMAGSNHEVEVRDAATGEEVLAPLSGHTDIVAAIAVSPDGSLLATGGYDGTVRLWDAETGGAVGPSLIAHNDYVIDVAFSPDGGTLASAGLDAVYLWEVDPGRLTTASCATAGRTLSATEWTAVFGAGERYEPRCTPELVAKPGPRWQREVVFSDTGERAAFDVWYDAYDMDFVLADVERLIGAVAEVMIAASADGDTAPVLAVCSAEVQSETLLRFSSAAEGAPDDVLVDAGTRFVDALTAALLACATGEPGFGTDALLVAMPAFAEFNERMMELTVGDRGVRRVGASG